MYNSLLLSTGGGVISNSQRAKQDGEPVVVIGCGGTGVNAASVLKDKIYKQLEPDDLNAEVPEYKHIRFVAIDSDSDWVGQSRLGNDAEFCNVQDPQVNAKFNNRTTLNGMMKEERFKWMSAGQTDKPNIQLPDDLKGAGGIRQVGRYLIINDAQKIYQKIDRAISNAVMGKDSSKLVVHIMAGISGGMGSGSFIDVCYIVRKILADKGFGQASVFGYFFLPDVLVTVPAISNDLTKKKSNYKNGYAALLELDYLMQLKENHDSFVQDYGTFSVNTNVPPVDMCHLVSAIDAAGNMIPDGQAYCMNVTADYIMSYLSKVDSSLDASAIAGITPKGVLSNVSQNMDMLTVAHGSYHRYHLLGASNAEIPMTMIATYLATGLYDQMSNLIFNEPEDSAVRVFAGDGVMKYTVQSLKQEVSKDVKLAPMVPQPEMSIPKSVTQSYVHSEAILKPLRDWLANQQNKVTANCQALNQELKEPYKYDANATSMAGCLFNKLYDYCTSVEEYGPYYASMLLERNGSTISTELDGLHKELAEQIKKINGDVDFQAEQVERAKQAFVSSKNTLFNKHVESDAYDAYRGAMGIWFRRQLDAFTYEQLDKLVVNFKAKVEEMNNRYFRRLRTVLMKLQDTFKANAAYFENPEKINSDIAEDGYTKRIIRFGEIKPHLDEVLRQEDVKMATAKFITYILENSSMWLGGEEYQIRRMVNDFIGTRFNAELSKSIEDQLRRKYPGLNTQELQNQMMTDIFGPLEREAVPKFWCTPSVSIGSTVSTVFLTVPEAASDLMSSAKNYGNNVGNFMLRPADISDRIFMFRLNSGMSLYGYHGLEQAKQAYDEMFAIPGLHLFERGEVNWKERVISPVPYSVDPSQIRGAEEIKEVIGKAKKAKIYRFEDERGTIYQSGLQDDVELMSLLREFKTYGNDKQELSASDINKLAETYGDDIQDVIEALENYREMMEKNEGAKTYSVQSDGTGSLIDIKQEVTEDHLIQSYVLRTILAEEVALYEGICEALKIAEKMVGMGDIWQTNFDGYCNALILGFIKQSIGKLSFTYERKHKEEEMILASQKMEYGKLLLYQGFVNYSEMDEDLKDELKELADHKLDNLEEGDEEIAVKIKKKYDARFMKDLEKIYHKDKNRADIDKFYDSFLDKLEAFIENFA